LDLQLAPSHLAQGTHVKTMHDHRRLWIHGLTICTQLVQDN
jgi:hypothetical protein